MSTHNIDFYEEMTKSYLSIIIKYTLYLFFWDGERGVLEDSLD